MALFIPDESDLYMNQNRHSCDITFSQKVLLLFFYPGSHLLRGSFHVGFSGLWELKRKGWLSSECPRQDACMLTLQSWSAVVRLRAIRVQLQALPLQRIIKLNAAFNHAGRLWLTSALPTMPHPPSWLLCRFIVRCTHLLQGIHWLGEDGLPVRPNEHDKNNMVHQQIHDWKQKKQT